MNDAIRQVDCDVLIAVWAKPRAKRTRCLGTRNGAVEIALSAPPADGAANEALVEFVAKKVGVAKSRVVFVRGHTSRDKVLRVTDAIAREVEGALNP